MFVKKKEKGKRRKDKEKKKRGRKEKKNGEKIIGRNGTGTEKNSDEPD